MVFTRYCNEKCDYLEERNSETVKTNLDAFRTQNVIRYVLVLRIVFVCACATYIDYIYIYSMGLVAHLIA